MRLKATCDIRLRAAETCPTVAMLRPRSGAAQWVTSESWHFEPQVNAAEYFDATGNLCQRFVVPKGVLRIRIETVVDTEPDVAVAPDAPPTAIELLPDGALQYLLPSRYCPSDKMMEQARQIVAGAAPGYAQVEAIRAWVHRHIEYRYGVSNEGTDALDTLAAGAGVCRDFSHIGISFCRALYIPARMVVGYLHRLDPMDLHAWFEAFVGGRWYTFDATQDRPRGGRIVIAYGRDVADVALVSNFGQLETDSLSVSVTLLDEALPALPA
ncbi:MAG TPA: transglutaminase family protein [Ideonella sp.]|uniref:transglutaminase-like domain-containing protein n=1 Tax=Ideonella sp. TaxID=1929293 RepID=UPI002CDC2DDA|nr:transglutaminase family protein [Ideonella sp.]HSI51934.1 transglutaminase family protein [Ideonella sp.]